MHARCDASVTTVVRCVASLRVGAQRLTGRACGACAAAVRLAWGIYRNGLHLGCWHMCLHRPRSGWRRDVLAAASSSAAALTVQQADVSHDRLQQLSAMQQCAQPCGSSMAAVSKSSQQAAAALTMQQAYVSHDRLQQLDILDHLQGITEGEEQSEAAAAACGLGLTTSKAGKIAMHSGKRG